MPVKFNPITGDFDLVKDVVGDTSPQLGGELDTNGNDISLDYGDKIVLHTSAGADGTSIEYPDDNNFGVDGVFFGGIDGAKEFLFPKNITFYSNTDIDGLGQWQPNLQMLSTGVWIDARTAAGNGSLTVQSDDKFTVNASGAISFVGSSFLINLNSRSANLKTDNLTSGRVYQFPDVGGELVAGPDGMFNLEESLAGDYAFGIHATPASGVGFHVRSIVGGDMVFDTSASALFLKYYTDSGVNQRGQLVASDVGLQLQATDLADTISFGIGGSGSSGIVVSQSEGVYKTGFNKTTPTEALDVLGNFVLSDAETPTKSYRFRTSGTNLDIDAAGKTLFISTYTDADFTGTQRQYIEFGAEFEFEKHYKKTVWDAGGADFIVFDKDATSVFNEGGLDRDFRFEGDTDPNLIFVDASTNRVGIGMAAPTEKLTVLGNFEVRDAITATKSYRFRTSGTNLDLDASGKDLYISNYSGAGFTGTQRQYMVMGAEFDFVNLYSSSWEWKDRATGTVQLKINGDTGILDFRGTMGNSTKDPTADAPADWLQIQIGGTTYYVPAYAA